MAQYTIAGPVPGLLGAEFRETLRDGNGSMQLRGRITGYAPNSLLECRCEESDDLVYERLVVWRLRGGAWGLSCS